MSFSRRRFFQCSVPALGALVWGCGSSASVPGSPLNPSAGSPSAPALLPLQQVIARADEEHSFFVDEQGNLFTLHQRTAVISKVDSLGKQIWQIDLKGLGPNQMDNPVAMAEDPQGRLWLIDRALSKIVLLNAQGQVLFEVAPGVSMLRPQDVVAAADRVFISDGYGHQILCLSLTGQLLGVLGRGLLNYPRGMALDRQQRLHVVDTGHSRVVLLSLEGQFLGSYAQDLLAHGQGLDIASDGLIAVGDGIAGVLRFFSPDLSLLATLTPTWEGRPVAPLDLQFGPTGALQLHAQLLGGI